MGKKILILVIFFSLLSLFFNTYKKSSAPACLNADEAAFGYNAYSILKTGKDEYGNTMPLRLKSFGDYKLPLYSYLSIPTISLFGLGESIRYTNTFFAILLPIIVYFLVNELFGNKKVALLSSFLIATSLGLQSVGRQAHEGYMAIFFISTTFLFFIRYLKKESTKNLLLFLFFSLLTLFSYQSGRIYVGFFILASFVYALRKKVSWKLPLSIIALLICFSLTDLINKPERVTKLIFFSARGFTEKITELRMEGGHRLIYNKITIGAKTVLTEHMKYFSPQFLALDGDTNYRFGFPDMSLMTILDYIFIFVGLYYIFKNKEEWRWFMLFLFLFAPLPGSLTWQSLSLPRSLFIFIPSLILTSYGIINLLNKIDKKYYQPAVGGLMLVEFLLLFYSWDFYLNHYPKRAITIFNWQCGYKELVDYVGKNYDRFNKIYVTRKHGQPYIFLLYLMNYPPAKYQKQANLSTSDQYGFGQVYKFDKFHFQWPNGYNEEKVVYLGYPDDFKNINPADVKKIEIGTEEIFAIYEKSR